VNHLGLDMHSSHFLLAHVNARGKFCRQYEQTTTGEHLLDVVGQVRGPKRLVVEESHLAQWVKHIAEPFVDELVICDPRRNRWISQDEFADDRSSARKLALLSHGGYLKAIRHPDQVGAELRCLFLHYHMLVRQTARFKNMLSATFRQVAIRAGGDDIYSSTERAAWLGKLKGFAALRHRASQCFSLLDSLTQKKQQSFRRMVPRVRGSGTYQLLQTLPGVGPVIACGYLALIDTPHRFSRKNKLWAYACLGNKYHESDRAVYAHGPSKTGCRPLKWLVMQQFNAAVQRAKAPNRFKREYEHLLATGHGPKTARRQVCRSMLSSLRAMWMKGQAYRDDA